MALPTAGDWEGFFALAGIPTRLAKEYAAVFAENRIRREFLGDLTKELLNEMGIKALGDVLAILKAAKRGFPESYGPVEPKPKVKPVAKPAPAPVRAVAPAAPPVKTVKASPPVKAAPIAVKAEVRPTEVTSTLFQRCVRAPPVRAPAKSVLIIAKPEPPPPKPKARPAPVAAPAEARAEPKVRLRVESSGRDSPLSHDDCAMVKAVREARKKLAFAPDADEYIVQMPKGSTPKSREILRKAAALKASASSPDLGLTRTISQPSASPVSTGVFNRLGTSLERKKIRLAREPSPEVSSTTDGDLEDLRANIRRKVPSGASGSGTSRAARFGLPVKGETSGKRAAEVDEESSSIRFRLGAKTASSPALVTKASKPRGVLDRLG